MQLAKEDCAKQINYHFHTCDYHSCITIVKGLQRITRYICQKVCIQYIHFSIAKYISWDIIRLRFLFNGCMQRNLNPCITLRQFVADISDKTLGKDDSAVFEEIFPHLQR